MKKSVLWVLLLVSVAANVWLCGQRGRAEHDTVRDTVRVRDTVLVRVPMVRDSTVIRTETVYLERVNDSTRHPTPDTASDTVAVRVPIVQRVYGDSTYTAWVSGFRASLDSIAVYRQTQTITVRQKPRRWQFGISAGYGLTPRGLQPYVGVGVTWRLW